MANYRLKNGPAFQVADGDMKGETFVPGRLYTKIPEHMTGLFVKVKTTAKTTKKSGVTDENATSEA